MARPRRRKVAVPLGVALTTAAVAALAALGVHCLGAASFAAAPQRPGAGRRPVAACRRGPQVALQAGKEGPRRWQRGLDTAFLDVDATPEQRLQGLRDALSGAGEISRAFQKAANAVVEKGLAEGHPEALDAIFPKGTLARSDLDGLIAVARQAPEVLRDVSGNSAAAAQRAAARRAEEGAPGPPSLERVRETLSRFLGEVVDEASNAFRGTPRGLQEPAFETLREGADFEIRRYPNFTVATRRMPAIDGYSWAAAEGFSTLAGYLAGENQHERVMKMSLPVKIDFRDDDPSVHTMSVVLPHEATRDNGLPKPNDPSVRVSQVPERLVAIRRFPGVATAGEVKQQAAKLLQALHRSGAWSSVAQGEYSVLQYNPPYTVPWRRRNEVAVVVAATGQPDATAGEQPEVDLQDELEALQRAQALEVDAFERREAELQKAKEHLESQNSELLQQVTVLAARKAAAEALIEQAEAKLAASSEKEHELLKSLAEKAEEASRLEGRLGVEEQREAALQQEIQLLLADYELVKVDLHKVQEELAQQRDELSAEVAALRQEEATLATRVRDAEASVERYEKWEQELTGLLQEKEAQVQGLAKKLEEAEQGSVQAQQSFDERVEELSAQLAQAQEVNRKLESALLSTKVQEGLEQQNMELNALVTSLQQKEADLMARLREAEATVSRFEQRGLELAELAEAKERQVAELAEKLDALERESADARRGYEESQRSADERYQDVVLQLMQAHQVNQELEAALRNASATEDLEQEKSQLTAKVAVLEGQVASLQEQAESLQAQLQAAQTAVSRYEAREAELTQLLQARDTEVAELTRRLRNQEEAMQESAKTQQIFDQRYQELLAQLMQAHEANQKLEVALRGAEQRLLQLWSKLNTLQSR